MSTKRRKSKAAMAQLELLGEKTLSQAASLLKYCPSMDLTALSGIDHQVLIYRLNGQRVYLAPQRNGSDLRVESIQWKPNGQLLAIAWSDGSVRLVSVESSKVVHQFSTSETSGVTCMSWSSNFADDKTDKLGMTKVKSDDFLASRDGVALDLPRDLSLIDIETSLPKLSVLAAGGSSEEVFSSRSSLDALFRPFDPRDNNSVDVMIVGTEEGHIHLSIYDSFVIGSFENPVVVGNSCLQLVHHASRPECSTHSLLLKSSKPDQTGLYFVPMDLRFISTSSEYLSLLASKSTALQNLLRYIHQVQILMLSEWRATQELPARFIRNINETLEEEGRGWDLVQSLYHAVATGHTFPNVREWLVDELTERGHKRWDKAVTTGLENLRRLVHENMLPALDRVSVILSRFAGIAKFQGSNESAGFSSHQIAFITDTVACLHLVSARILLHTVDELDLFSAFSAWMRYEIDRLASDSSNTPNEEAIDKEASIDHVKVLSYIQTCMTSSPLAVFIGDEDHSESFATENGLILHFDELETQLHRQEKGLAYKKSLPRVNVLCKYLTQQAHVVFSQIAEAEKRNVLFGKPLEIGAAQHNSPMNMTMLHAENKQLTSNIATVAFISEGSANKSPDQIRIVKISLDVLNGVSIILDAQTSAIHLLGGVIKDFKLSCNHSAIYILWDCDGSSHVLRFAIGDEAINYIPLQPKGPVTQAIVFDREAALKKSMYTIPSDSSFIPTKMEFRDDHTRIIILGQDGLHYKIFDPKGAEDAFMIL